MATFTVYQTFDNRDGEESRDSAGEYTRTFLVKSDDPTVGQDEVLQAEDLPGIGDPYQSASGTLVGGAVVIRRRASQYGESPYLWMVEVQYSAASEKMTSGGGDSLDEGGGSGEGGGGDNGGDGGGNGGGGNGNNPPGSGQGGGGAGPGESQIANPLLRPPEVSWHFNKIMEVAREDVYGQPILNSASIPFDPPLEREKTRMVCRIKRNQAKFSALAMLKYHGALNSKKWAGFEEFTCRLQITDATRHYENGIFYWEVTYEIEIDPLGWTTRVLDATWSWYEDGKLVIIRDDYGAPLSSPRLLNGAGEPLDPDTEDPVFLEFDLHQEADFNDLKLTK